MSSKHQVLCGLSGKAFQLCLTWLVIILDVCVCVCMCEKMADLMRGRYANQVLPPSGSRCQASHHITLTHTFSLSFH